MRSLFNSFILISLIGIITSLNIVSSLLINHCHRHRHSSLRIMKMSSSSIGNLNLREIVFDNYNIRSLPVDKIKDGPVRQTPGVIYSFVKPQKLKNVKTIAYSNSALNLLNVKDIKSNNDEIEIANILSGNDILPDSEPVAHCYCGHQFGSFAGQLGDGAAISLGEIINENNNKRYELQLKGAGLTPYSRTADGRKVLRSSVREFLMSESMYYLNIPTTRAASIVTSESTVIRDPFYDGTRLDEKCTVVSRIAINFFRFGSFEIFKKKDDNNDRPGPSSNEEYAPLKKKLLDHIINNYYNDIRDNYDNDNNKKYQEFFKEVVKRTAILVAKWQAVGWVHGVLNTDNMSIMGLTIDYGPYGFMESFDKDFTPNGSDGSARYSFSRQAEMCKWNCGKLAEMLVPYISIDESNKIINEIFDNTYAYEYKSLMSSKLGLITNNNNNNNNNNNKSDKDDIDILIDNLLTTLGKTNTDYTDSFLALSKYACGEATREITIERLKSRCAPPKILEEQLRRKMRIMRLTMNPQQIMGVWQLLQENPDKASIMFGGLPVDVIRNEIGGEKRKLDLLVEASQTIESLKDITIEQKSKYDIDVWNEFLNAYDKVLKDQPCDNIKRKEITSQANPTFILRNWVAQIAIEKAEIGDYSGVRTVLDMLSSPYNSKYDPFKSEIETDSKIEVVKEEEKAYLGLPPDWAAPLICTCSS